MDIRNNAPEIDALRQGMDWDCEDIERYQILIETVYGDSHPGSTHLDRLAKMADDGIKYRGAKPSHFTATDICDGIAQGHDGMNYSLASREIIAAMCEIHAKANGFDGAVFISSCDKAVPAHLMAMARLNLPSVFVPGGTMPLAARRIYTRTNRKCKRALQDGRAYKGAVYTVPKRRLHFVRSLSVHGYCLHNAGYG